MSPKEELHYIVKAVAQKQATALEAEYRFHPEREWRFDYAFPDVKVAIEYNGHHSTGFAQGIRKRTSGHSSIKGITNDAEKGNAASLLDWHVIRLTALHFSRESRAKHKLRGPMDLITSMVVLRLCERPAPPPQEN